jgi:PAS domain S-box-containing protein
MALAADAASLGLWVWDISRNNVWMSQRGKQLFGYSADAEVTLEMLDARAHPEDRAARGEALRRALADTAPYDLQYRLLLPDGTVRWIAALGHVEFNAAGKAVRMLGTSIDITQRKQSEQKLAQQRNELAHLSRVATVGELFGSLAHELNQPLAIILTNAQAAQRFLAQQPPDLAEARDILADIVSEDQRAGEVIRRLRSLLKHGEISRQPLAINDIVNEVLQLSRSDLIRHGITIRSILAADLPPVAGDRIQLQQVLLNLILNACDSMAGTPPDGRQITVATARCDGAVRVSVADAGCGLPPDVERVFEPFYTTKKQGLGLGLAICRSIASAHEGRLWAENGAGGGAVFHLELPVGGE